MEIFTEMVQKFYFSYLNNSQSWLKLLKKFLDLSIFYGNLTRLNPNLAIFQNDREIERFGWESRGRVVLWSI